VRVHAGAIAAVGPVASIDAPPRSAEGQFDREIAWLKGCHADGAILASA
jgi:hypothetical protein